QWIQNPSPARAYRFDSDRGQSRQHAADPTGMSSFPPPLPGARSVAPKGTPPIVLYAGDGTNRAAPRPVLPAPGHDEPSEFQPAVPLHRHLFVIAFLFFSVALTYGNS